MTYLSGQPGENRLRNTFMYSIQEAEPLFLYSLLSPFINPQRNAQFEFTVISHITDWV